MGSNVGKDKELVSIVTKVVKEVAKVPVWAKLTPSTTDIVVEARGAFLGGADAISSSNTFTSLPLIDAETLEFEMNVDGLRLDRRPRRPGDPAAVAREDVAADAGVSRQGVLRHRRHLELRARAELLPARLRHGAGLHRGDARSRDRPERDPRSCIDGLTRFLEKHADHGWTTLDDFVGLRRDRVVAQSQIRRPDVEKEYRGGYERGRLR